VTGRAAQLRVAIAAELLEQEREQGSAIVGQVVTAAIGCMAEYHEKTYGALAAYELVQRIADDTAARIPARPINARREKE
jgi:hypothetical protein